MFTDKTAGYAASTLLSCSSARLAYRLSDETHFMVLISGGACVRLEFCHPWESLFYDFSSEAFWGSEDYCSERALFGGCAQALLIFHEDSVALKNDKFSRIHFFLCADLIAF